MSQLAANHLRLNKENIPEALVLLLSGLFLSSLVSFFFKQYACSTAVLCISGLAVSSPQPLSILQWSRGSKSSFRIIKHRIKRRYSWSSEKTLQGYRDFQEGKESKSHLGRHNIYKEEEAGATCRHCDMSAKPQLKSKFAHSESYLSFQHFHPLDHTVYYYSSEKNTFVS